MKHGVVLGQDTSSLKPGFLLEGEHADMILSVCPSNAMSEAEVKRRRLETSTKVEIHGKCIELKDTISKHHASYNYAC